MSQARLPRTEPSTELITAHKGNNCDAHAALQTGDFSALPKHRVQNSLRIPFERNSTPVAPADGPPPERTRAGHSRPSPRTRGTLPSAPPRLRELAGAELRLLPPLQNGLLHV